MKKRLWIVALALNGFLYAQTGDWVAKVDSRVITSKEFQGIYESQLDVSLKKSKKVDQDREY
jgi:hypothetical protein